jgi:hypothetical protein
MLTASIIRALDNEDRKHFLNIGDCLQHPRRQPTSGMKWFENALKLFTKIRNVIVTEPIPVAARSKE